jgi:N-acetylmuramoyl-L-alanine amidase
VFGQPLDPSLIDQAIRENGGGEVGQALTQEAAEHANIAGEIVRQNQLSYSLNLAEAVQSRLVSATGARDRGVRQNLFYVIRTARIPAILVEVGFISNPDEGPKLATERYQRTISRALADGILEFLESGGAIASR